MEVVLTTAAIRCAKPQSKCHQNQHPVFLQVGCPSCHPTNSVKALKDEIEALIYCY